MTILLASHSVYPIRQMCDTALWMHDGEIAVPGDLVTVSDRSVDHVRSSALDFAARNEDPRSGAVHDDEPHLHRVQMTRNDASTPERSFQHRDVVVIHVPYRAPVEAQGFHLNLTVRRNDYVLIFTSSAPLDPPSNPSGERILIVRLSLVITAGEYILCGTLSYLPSDETIDQRQNWFRFRVENAGIEKGVSRPTVEWLLADNTS